MSRVFTPFILLLAVALTACNDAPTSLATDEAAGVSEARLETISPRQGQKIEELASALEAAWAVKDAAAYAALYAEDVEFVGPTGQVVSGRDALRAAHVGAFSTIFAQSTLDVEVRRIEFLTRKIAIVDLAFENTGFSGLPPGLRTTEPGVLRNAVRWVVVRRHPDGWQILAQQMTPVPPLP